MALGRVNVPGFIKFNTDEIDSKTGSSSNLNTESKSNFISSINEIQGESASLTTNASSAMTAAQSASTAASTAGSTASTAKTNADSAADTAGTANTNANSALTKIGDLSSLETETKSSIVAAVNELLTSGGGGGSHSSDPELSFSAVSAEVPGTNQSVGINCTYRGSGVLTATSSAPDVIAVSIQTLGSGAVTVKKIILTRVSYSQDDTTINIAVTSDGEHVAASGTITVAGQTIASLEDTDWAVIQGVGAAGTGANYWDIGDTKTITLNGKIGDYFTASNLQLKVFIIEFNYRGDNGIYFQGFKTLDGVDVALCDSLYGGYSNIVSTGATAKKPAFNMEHSLDNGNVHANCENASGWKGCDLRYDILGSVEKPSQAYRSSRQNRLTDGYDATEAAKTSPVANTLMAALPADLRAALAAWTIYSNNRGHETQASSASSSQRAFARDAISTSVDYLPLLAMNELFGDSLIPTWQYSPYEREVTEQMAYYKNGNTLIKYKNNDTTTACQYWSRSVSGAHTNICFAGPDTTGTNQGPSHSGVSWGIAPAFRVA